MKRRTEILFILLLTGMATAQEWPFQKYPAPAVQEKTAPPEAETQLTREHISSIRAAVTRGANFAGHYTIADWGCGTGCAIYVIVDNRTGKIYAPPEISRVDLGIGGPEYRANSSLMVLANCPDPKIYGLKNCLRKLYKWNGSRLVLLKTEPVKKGETSH